MGGEESKVATSKTDKKCVWLSVNEINSVKNHVEILSKLSSSVNIDNLKGGTVLLTNEAYAARLLTLIKNYKGGSNGLTSIPCQQLTQIFIELLNHDHDYQADLILKLSGGKDGFVDPEDLIECVSTEIHGYSSLPENKLYSSSVSKRDGSSDAVAKAWLQEILYDGVSFKQSAGKDITSGPISHEKLARWLSGHSGIFFNIHYTLLKKIIAPALPASGGLLPIITNASNISMPLSTPELLILNTALPSALRCEWRLLFSNTIHGDSFSLLMKQIVGAGPSIVVVEDEEGNRFGGFASASWEVRPQFHGTAESFLFSLRPSAGIYHSTGYNTNFQYLNFLHNNTMPNGLGMGGREELFGMFLSADFGDCQVAPTCSTYQSPPLCPTQSPRLKYLSVWGVGEEAKDSDDEDAPRTSRSALDHNPDATAMLDMIGRSRASDGLREPDPILE